MTAALLLIAYLAAGELITAHMDRRHGGAFWSIYRPADRAHVALLWALWPLTLLLLLMEAELVRELRDLPHPKPLPRVRLRDRRPLLRSLSHELRFFTRRRKPCPNT